MTSYNLKVTLTSGEDKFSDRVVLDTCEEAAISNALADMSGRIATLAKNKNDTENSILKMSKGQEKGISRYFLHRKTEEALWEEYYEAEKNKPDTADSYESSLWEAKQSAIASAADAMKEESLYPDVVWIADVFQHDRWVSHKPSGLCIRYCTKHGRGDILFGGHVCIKPMDLVREQVGKLCDGCIREYEEMREKRKEKCG